MQRERGGEENVQMIVADFKKWMEDVDGWFCVVNCDEEVASGADKL